MLEGLREYAKTEAEVATLEAVIATNGNRAQAARNLGKADSTVKQCILNLKSRQARHDPEAHTVTAPEGYVLAGVSTYTKSESGAPMWVKTKASTIKQQEMMQQFVSALCSDITPIDPIPAPDSEGLNTDVIPWFQMGDAHIGMIAHRSEVGHDFNLEIAERELIKAFAIMIERAPACERCVFQDLGDGTHFENFAAVTEASRHALDAAGTFPQVVRAYARIIRTVIDMLLAKFRFDDGIFNQGNHSRKNDIWIVIFLEALHEKNDRFHVLNNDSVFIPYRMGNTFVLCHHTDKCKPAQMAAVMANTYAQDWGETKYHYMDGGHVHHRQSAKELNGAIYESWNQLAPSDKYAHDKGYGSRSCLNVVLRSKTYGDQGRITLSAEEVKDLLDDLPAGTSAQKRIEVYTV